MTDKIYVPAWVLVLPINEETGKVDSYTDVSPISVESEKAGEYDFYFNTYEECDEYCRKEEVRNKVKFFSEWSNHLKDMSADYKEIIGHGPNIKYLYPRLFKC